MIAEFQGPHRFLSNFWPAVVSYEGHTYPTVEHAYQAAKFTAAHKRESILRLPTPGLAKKEGRSRAYFRPDWESVKLTVMEYLLRQKFAAGSPLAELLLTTGGSNLVEGNRWHDNFWGSCSCQRCCSRGSNHLGHLLMQIRSELSPL